MHQYLRKGAKSKVSNYQSINGMIVGKLLESVIFGYIWNTLRNIILSGTPSMGSLEANSAI